VKLRACSIAVSLVLCAGTVTSCAGPLVGFYRGVTSACVLDVDNGISVRLSISNTQPEGTALAALSTDLGKRNIAATTCSTVPGHVPEAATSIEFDSTDNCGDVVRTYHARLTDDRNTGLSGTVDVDTSQGPEHCTVVLAPDVVD
jgi:hypothetical protein